MADKFKNKYRIASARHQNWDYRWAGAYFITICTENRTHFFGEITDGQMNLYSIGVIADILWYEIKNHAKNVDLGEFVVMPNHIHGVLILNDVDDEKDKNTLVDTDMASNQKTIGQQRFQNQGKNSVSSIIGGYKAAVTKHARRLGFDFGWQTRFYDNIIKSDESFQRITNYIINNPVLWKDDKFY